MTISIFLIPYAIAVFIFVFMSLISLYHIFHLGVKTFPTFLLTFLFIAISVILLYESYSIISVIDWSVPLLDGLSVTIPL